MTREKISRETNEGVMMHCKTITANFFTIVGLLVEPSPSIVKKRLILRHISPFVKLPEQ